MRFNRKHLPLKMTKRRKRTYLIVALVAVSFIFRIGYLLKYPIPVRDAYSYQSFLEEWIIKKEIPYDPVYPPLGLFFFKILAPLCDGDIFKSGISISIVFGLCTLIVLAQIIYEIYPKNYIIACTGLALTTHPKLIHYSCQMLRENSYLFFCSLSILFLVKAIKTSHVQHIIAMSFFSAAACMCRYEGLEICVVICSLLLIWKKTIWTFLQNISLYLIVFVISVLLISYTIRIPSNYCFYALMTEFSSRMN